MTVITSDSLEYSSETRQYVAKGSVKIVQDDTIITADELTYDETTSGVVATGSVDYRDSDASMQARKAELNLDRKTGTLFDANIFYAKNNYHMSGEVLEKTGRTLTTVRQRSSLPVIRHCLRGVSGQRM